MYEYIIDVLKISFGESQSWEPSNDIFPEAFRVASFKEHHHNCTKSLVSYRTSQVSWGGTYIVQKTVYSSLKRSNVLIQILNSLMCRIQYINRNSEMHNIIILLFLEWVSLVRFLSHPKLRLNKQIFIIYNTY